MTTGEKLESLGEVFENPKITPETRLDEIDWDSMAMLSVMAVVKNNGKNVTGQQLREARTISDLMAIM